MASKENLYQAYQRRLKECVTNLRLRGEIVVRRKGNGRMFPAGNITRMRDRSIVNALGKLVRNG